MRVLFLRNVKILKSLKDCWSADVGYSVTALKKEAWALYLSARISSTYVNTDGK